MKNFTTVSLYIYALAITVLSFFVMIKLQNIKEGNRELQSQLSRTKEALEFKIEECESSLDLEGDRDQRYEMEISYWGRMYEAMKEKHPKTAADLEKQNLIPNTDHFNKK